MLFILVLSYEWNNYLFIYLFYLYIFILLIYRKATKAVIHKVSNYPGPASGDAKVAVRLIFNEYITEI